MKKSGQVHFDVKSGLVRKGTSLGVSIYLSALTYPGECRKADPGAHHWSGEEEFALIH